MLPHERASLVLMYDLYIRNLMYDENFSGKRAVIETYDDAYPHNRMTFKIEEATKTKVRLTEERTYKDAWTEREMPSSHRYNFLIEADAEVHTFTLEYLNSKNNAVAELNGKRYYMRNIGSTYERRIEIEDGKKYEYKIEIDGDRLGRGF